MEEDVEGDAWIFEKKVTVTCEATVTLLFVILRVTRRFQNLVNCPGSVTRFGGVIMDMNAPHIRYGFCHQLLHAAGDTVPFGHAQGAVNANGEIHYNVRSDVELMPSARSAGL